MNERKPEVRGQRSVKMLGLGIVLGGLLLMAIGAVKLTSLSDGSYTFDSGTVTVAGDGAYHAVATVQAQGRPVRIQGTVGSVALAGLKVTDTPVQGGTESTLAADTDFNTATNPGVAFARPTNAYQTSAGATFDLLLTAGGADYVIYAKSSGGATSVRVVGTVLVKGVY